MENAQNRLSAASAKVMEAREALEHAHSRFAAARVGYSQARKKKEATYSFRKEREKWSRLSASVQTELSRREKNLIEHTEKIVGIEKEIKEIEAHFAQTELLRFVLSERYAFSPQTFANAAAGLPHMAWRTSMRRCSRVQCSAKPSINHVFVEAVKMILEGASPTCAEEAAREIHREISKGNQFERVREYLGENWPALEHAVFAVWNSSSHADARPYEIASMFLGNLKAPRRAVNPLLDALEKDLPPT
jgi:chromosome segregation ATPase